MPATPSNTPRPPPRRRFRRVLLSACLPAWLGLSSGCVAVKAYQREPLTEHCMAPGFGDRSELKFRAHWEGSRQGTEGGFGEAGGGCGCN